MGRRVLARLRRYGVMHLVEQLSEAPTEMVAPGVAVGVEVAKDGPAETVGSDR